MNKRKIIVLMAFMMLMTGCTQSEPSNTDITASVSNTTTTTVTTTANVTGTTTVTTSLKVPATSETASENDSSDIDDTSETDSATDTSNVSSDNNEETTTTTTTATAQKSETQTNTTAKPITFTSTSKTVYTTSYVPFRSEPKDNGSIMVYINPSETVTVTSVSSDNKWYGVTYNGMKGYALVSNTTTTKPSTTTTTSTTTSKKTSSATQSTKSNKSMITITLNATGGTCSKSSIQVEEGSKIYTLPTATRNGYRFTGWSAWENYNFPLDKNTDGSYNISTYSNKIFYACWNKVHTGIDADADDTCISNCVSYVTGRYHPESYYINIGKNLKNDGTDYDKALQVYKWMRKNGQGNCVDYSVETYLVCKGIGLECIFVHKTSRGFYGHTYNFVKLDGKYYNFDTQSGGDPLGSAGPRCRTFDINDNDVTVPAGKSYAQDHGIDGSKVKDDFHV